MKKAKFVFLVFLMFISPYLILSIHFLDTAKKIYIKDVLSFMELKSRIIASNLDDFINLKYDVLSFIREPEFLNLSLDEKKKYITKLYSSNKDFIKEIIIANVSGESVFSTDKNTKYNFKNDPIFQNAKFENFSVGAVTYYDNGPAILTIAEPIIRLKGEKPQFIAIARVSLSRLNQEVLKASRNIPGYILLIDSDGRIVCDSSYNYIFNSGLFIDEKIKNIISSLIGSKINSYNGYMEFKDGNKLISISKIESTNFWLCEIENEKNIINYSSIRWAKRIVIAGAILIAIFSFLTLKLAILLFKVH